MLTNMAGQTAHEAEFKAHQDDARYWFHKFAQQREHLVWLEKNHEFEQKCNELGQNKIKELEQKVGETTGHDSSREQYITALQGEAEESKKQYKDADNELQKCKKKLADTTRQRDDFKKKLDDAKSHAEQLMIDVEQAEGERDKARANFETMKAEHDRMTVAYDSALQAMDVTMEDGEKYEKDASQWKEISNYLEPVLKSHGRAITLANMTDLFDTLNEERQLLGRVDSSVSMESAETAPARKPKGRLSDEMAQIEDSEREEETDALTRELQEAKQQNRLLEEQVKKLKGHKPVPAAPATPVVPVTRTKATPIGLNSLLLWWLLLFLAMACWLWNSWSASKERRMWVDANVDFDTVLRFAMHPHGHGQWLFG